MSYRMRPVRDAQEWEEYFSGVSRLHLMQSYAYGEAKKRAENWNVRRFVFELHGKPLAICQVLERRVVGFSFASRINRGPLFLDELPSLEVKENVMRLVRDQWRVFHGGPLLIAPSLDMSRENRDLLLKLGFKDRQKNAWCSSLIDLQAEESEMQKRLAVTWRNRLRASQNAGLQLRMSNSPDCVEWMLNKHVENMRSMEFRGPKRRLLEALYNARTSGFMVAQAVFQGEPVAGMALVTFGHTAEYYVGWFGEAGRKFNCGNFLYWNAATEMKKRGYSWLDLGGYYSDDKFGRFKQGMRGQEYRLIGEWMCY